MNMNDSVGLQLPRKILVPVVMILFFTIVSILILYYFLKSLSFEAITGRLDGQPASAACHSLDPYILNSIPVHTFNSKELKDGIECAVCLSETVDGEKIRILPKCNHGFHMDCIDMWFHSNSTCPVCRNLVSNESESKMDNENTVVFPTEFSGEFTSLSSTSKEPSPSSFTSSSSSSLSNVRPEEMLVIDIPRQINEDDEMKSPIMKPLKRLLSLGTTTVSPSSSVDPDKMGTQHC